MADADLMDDLVALCRLFGLAERDQICCGTITVPQCVGLQALLSGPLEAKALAVTLGSSPSAATRLVDGMVKHGWVERARDTADRRKVHVQLTAAGEAQAQALRGMTAQMVQAMLAQIPAEKHAQVIESMRLVRQAAERVHAQGMRCC